MTALVAPLALIGGLALAGGGFDATSRHLAGLAAWLVVVGLLVLGAGGGATLGRPFYVGGGLIVALAFLSAISSLWSGSVELSVIEADRVLVYLAFFLATFLIAQTDERRQRFAEGLAISLALVAVLGLGSRLLPHLLEVSNSLGTGPRLRYPLGYWNANGEAFGIGMAMLLWMSRRSSWEWLRWVSVGLMPVMLVALYFTYSRGGLLSLAVAAGVLIALSADRLWLLGTLAIGAVGALPALLAVQSRDDLANNLASQAAVDQGATVFFVLLAGIVLTLGLFALLRRLERRGGQLTGRAVALSRDPALLRWLAFAGAVLAIGAAIAVGGRAWHQFSSSDIQFPAQPAQHFSQFSGAGRHDFWRVAGDAFEEKPILGHGAGTYQFSWQQLRSIELPVHDAHSLYLEAFAELGLVGGLTVLALVGGLLWFGFSAWRAAAEPHRDRYAVLLAAMTAFAAGAALDWFWEIAALGAIFFLAGGVVVAARCGQLAQTARGANGTLPGQRRFGLAVAGVALAWVAALGLVGPLLVEHELKASKSAAAERNYPSATDHAETARSIEPWAATPYVQLGLLAELEGNFALASQRLSDAIERENRNWQLYYLLARIENEGGNRPAAEAALQRARELNPLSPEVQQLPAPLAQPE